MWFHLKVLQWHLENHSQSFCSYKHVCGLLSDVWLFFHISISSNATRKVEQGPTKWLQKPGKPCLVTLPPDSLNYWISRYSIKLWPEKSGSFYVITWSYCWIQVIFGFVNKIEDMGTSFATSHPMMCSARANEKKLNCCTQLHFFMLPLFCALLVLS